MPVDQQIVSAKRTQYLVVLEKGAGGLFLEHKVRLTIALNEHGITPDAAPQGHSGNE
jgi:hypothetical protein